jgi:hypothetical protein
MTELEVQARHRAPGGPMVDLTPEARGAQQQAILGSAPRPYGVEAKVIFWLEDRVWGTERTLSKFKAQELVARSPYRAWEHDDPDDEAARTEAANERSHWNVLRDLMEEDGIHDNPVRYTVVPALCATAMYLFTRVQHRLKPGRSYRLNVDIEDHAAHEYARFVEEHPEWESRAYSGDQVYGRYASRSDVLRQICCDEQVHRQRSLRRAAED